jgi:ubiquinone/menaquinone biosynthesis C-methylase UbiE
MLKGEDCMGIYNRFVLPHVIELAMRPKYFAPFRARAAGAARGRVLEVGIGSGLNLTSYPSTVESVEGIDLSGALLAMAATRVNTVHFPVHLTEAASESLPFDDRSFDTIVMTFTLCSIPDTIAALAEMRRVLKPEGELRFAEHGRAPDQNVMRWQDWLTPAWKRIGGGCHLNREIDALIESAGFRLEGLTAGYENFGPRPFSFIYEGTARPA